MTPPRGCVALVTGANGISGNALIEHLIRQPKSEWARIIVTSRKPTKEHFSLDFLKEHGEIIAAMAPFCANVTHVFYTSYVHSDDFKQLLVYNVPLFENFLKAVEEVAATSLQRICLQTGGKHYGAHIGPGPAPYSEDQPRYNDHGENFYYIQEDFMFARQKEAASRGHIWHYNIIRPNAIIGFTPANNGMSEAITMALYFLICHELGQPAIFPGNAYFYNSVDDCSSAKGLADLSVWSMTQEHTKDEAFNHVNGDTYIWRYFWPRIGAYFGVEVPEAGNLVTTQNEIKLEHRFAMGDWAKDKREVWHRIVEKYGGDKEAFEWGTWGFLDWATGKNWSTISSMSKARAYGWNRYDDTYDTYTETFRAFENAGILPTHLKRNALIPVQTKI